MSKILLLAYPRSGSTWVRYILEYNTGYPSIGYDWFYEGSIDRPLLNVFKRETFKTLSSLDLDRAVRSRESARWLFILPSLHLTILKYHAENPSRRKEVKNILNNDNPIFLLLLRDPIESFIRHRGPGSVKNLSTLHINDYYFTNIQLYENYQGPKKIIYYEDLICDSQPYIKELCSFLNTDPNRLSEFFINFEQHRQRTREFYGDCTTNGLPDSLTEHSKAVTLEVKNNFWKHIFDIYNRKITQHLERYRI